MHIDDLRVAIFNYLCATQANEKLLIRIKDTDKEKNIDTNVQEVLEILAFFGLSFSDVSYQSHNLKFHQQLATKLLMDKHAFSCFCPSTATDADTKRYSGACENLHDHDVINNESPFCVRVRHPQNDIDFTDKIKGKTHFSKNKIDSFIILHVDKTPTSDFACAIDDLLSDISTVIQEENQLSHVPKQIMIRNYLGYNKKITYAHLPMILEGSISVKWLLEEGYLPQAIANYLILLGNTSPEDIFDIEQAIAWFDLASISKTPVKFDIATLKEINREHIRRLPALELAKFIGYSSKDLGELAKIYTEESSTINEIKPKIDAIFAKKEPLGFQKECAVLSKVAKTAPYFKEFDDFKAHLAKESGLEGKQLLEPLRVLLTGAENSPNLSKIYPYIRNYLGEIIK